MFPTSLFVQYVCVHVLVQNRVPLIELSVQVTVSDCPDTGLIMAFDSPVNMLQEPREGM